MKGLIAFSIFFVFVQFLAMAVAGIAEGEHCGCNTFEDNCIPGNCNAGLTCVFEGFGGYGTCTKN